MKEEIKKKQTEIMCVFFFFAMHKETNQGTIHQSVSRQLSVVVVTTFAISGARKIRKTYTHIYIHEHRFLSITKRNA